MITDNREQTYILVVDEMKAHYRERGTSPTYDLKMQDDPSMDPSNHPIWADWIKVSRTSSGCVGSLIITEQDTNPNDVLFRSYGSPFQALAAAILYNTDVYVASCEAACEELNKPDSVHPVLIRCKPADPWKYSFVEWTKTPEDALLLLCKLGPRTMLALFLSRNQVHHRELCFSTQCSISGNSRVLHPPPRPPTMAKSVKEKATANRKTRKKRRTKGKNSGIMDENQEFRRLLNEILANEALIGEKEWPKKVPPLGKFLLTSFTFWQL